MTRNARIIFAPLAKAKMSLLIDLCNDEIGWLASVHEKIGHEEQKIYWIDDVFVFGQEVNGATTEIDALSIGKITNELIEKTGGVEIANRLRLWGHSHVNMGVFASSQDDAQMRLFQDTSYMIRVIGNKRGEMKVDLYLYAENMVLNNLPWELGGNALDPNALEVLRKEMQEEIEKKVKRKIYKPYQTQKTLQTEQQRENIPPPTRIQWIINKVRAVFALKRANNGPERKESTS